MNMRTMVSTRLAKGHAPQAFAREEQFSASARCAPLCVLLAEEARNQIHRQREHDGRVLVRADHRERFQVAQLDG
ncbi:hypothetical protein ACSFA3_24000, partial [Variovorax sp. RHLX14]|uniref:hypothetical protein n=1 Tax=Variovorax sp. RHLX14 TaxID=1259731 RepID=UPI003F47655D